jgi:hypothetical protein
MLTSVAMTFRGIHASHSPSLSLCFFWLHCRFRLLRRQASLWCTLTGYWPAGEGAGLHCQHKQHRYNHSRHCGSSHQWQSPVCYQPAAAWVGGLLHTVGTLGYRAAQDHEHRANQAACMLAACRFAWRQLPAADFSLKTYSSTPGGSCCSRRWLGLARSQGASAAERAAVEKSAGRTGP